MTRPDISFAVLLGCFVLLWLGAGLLVFDYPPAGHAPSNVRGIVHRRHVHNDCGDGFENGGKFLVPGSGSGSVRPRPPGVSTSRT